MVYDQTVSRPLLTTGMTAPAVAGCRLATSVSVDGPLRLGWREDAVLSLTWRVSSFASMTASQKEATGSHSVSPRSMVSTNAGRSLPIAIVRTRRCSAQAGQSFTVSSGRSSLWLHPDVSSFLIRHRVKMCILFMYNGTCDAKSDYSLVLVSNRDEYYNRPTQNMAPWKEDPNVIGGRDLEVNGGGTWLAVAPTRNKLGVLLNLPGKTKNPEAKSRGRIVTDYVKSDKTISSYILNVRNYARECNDFLFVAVEFKSPGPIISSYSNASDEHITHKEPFVGFGNSLPDEPLKKVEAGTNKLMQILNTYHKLSMQEELLEKLIELLKSDERHLPDHQLETKRPNLYKELSSIFVSIPQGNYGTRTHTIVLVTKAGHMKIIEITQESTDAPMPNTWTRSEFEYDMELK